MAILKTDADRNALRESGKILVAALEEMVAAIRPGMTTQELNDVGHRVITEHGAKPAFLGYEGFPAAACISVNHEIVHAIPKERQIFEGDIVSLDLGVNYKGLITDAATTVSLGEPSAQVRKLIATTALALQEGIAAATIQATTGDIGAVIQKRIESAGFTVVRDLAGHATGYKVHEDPLVPNFGREGQGAHLEEGQVLALEPIATLGADRIAMENDGWTIVSRDEALSSHHEKTILITANGPELITPHDFPIVIHN